MLHRREYKPLGGWGWGSAAWEAVSHPYRLPPLPACPSPDPPPSQHQAHTKATVRCVARSLGSPRRTNSRCRRWASSWSPQARSPRHETPGTWWKQVGTSGNTYNYQQFIPCIYNYGNTYIIVSIDLNSSFAIKYRINIMVDNICIFYFLRFKLLK